MEEDLTARRLFKEQIRKELLEELRGYQVGLVQSGSMIALKTLAIPDGFFFIIPTEKYKELFRED